MAEQSSMAVVFRALVMLVCLVAIPLVAIFGKSLPEMLEAGLEGRWAVGTASAGAEQSEAPRFEPGGTAGVGPTVGASLFGPSRAGPVTQAAAVRSDGAVLAAGGELPPHSATVDHFGRIQGRLRELGVTYYLLESWGSRQQLYRFYCKIAVGGDPSYTRCFEATDSDPLQAMTRVQGQVETWQASRR